MAFWSTLFGSGTVGAVERIASELIETDKESAEAKAVMVKTLDPNGLMRRDISRRVRDLYTVYILMMVVLVIARAFDIGNAESVQNALDSLTSLFTPITTMFTAIVGASFGTNISNNIKESKLKGASNG